MGARVLQSAIGSLVRTNTISVKVKQLTSAPGRSESDQNILVTTNNSLERGVGQELNLASLLLRGTGLDASLLGDEGRQAVEITTTLVLLGLVTLSIEILNSGETLNTETLAQVAVRISVDLADGNLVLSEGKDTSKLLVDGGESLAVAAPRGEELNKRGLAGLQDDIVEVLGDEVDDSGAGVGEAAERGEGARQHET